MKRFLTILLALGLLLPAVVALPTMNALASWTIPTISIVSVVPDKSVTIQTYNFPANDSFEVLMGPIGTKGINGIKVATTASGNGGSFQATYTIPAGLKGAYQIAIRLQSPYSGYFAYNWFYNNTSGSNPPPPPPPPGYSGFPTFSIQSVVRDTSVTVSTSNLPPNDTFDVLMGPMGTKGVNGIKVASTPSGKGGSQQFTYNIPAGLKGSYQIAIRLQSPTSGYFAYNWFYNNTTP
jgi:hypothetical protein